VGSVSAADKSSASERAVDSSASKHRSSDAENYRSVTFRVSRPFPPMVSRQQSSKNFKKFRKVTTSATRVCFACTSLINCRRIRAFFLIPTDQQQDFVWKWSIAV
jgi:hypothetical protein